jgi:uncharacterized protein YcgI (DUF1989 family)
MKPMWGPNELLEHERALASQPVMINGDVIDDVLIPARGFLRARKLRAGQIIRFIDVEGQQVPDVILYDPNNLKNCSSMTNTILVAKTWKISKGHSIYAKLGQKMATIVEDTVGTNVAAGGFCNFGVNEARYGIEGTHSCRINFVASMWEYNLSPADIEEGCFVPFMNMQYESDGTCTIQPPTSKPGDYLELRADMDILVAVSNCPSERNPCNGWNPTALRVVIYQPKR